MLAGPLTLGLADPLYIRQEQIALPLEPCRLLYASDLHLRPRRAATLSRLLLRAARHSSPHALLLGGDLVDSASQLENLRALIRDLSSIAPVLAVGGNHDRHVGMDRVHDATVAGGGTWIHSSSAAFRHASRTIAIAGPDAPAPPSADVRILCAHHPRIWKTARHLGYHLVLAGHLHGCQFVAFQLRDRLFPGALFYPCCFLNRQYRSARLVVSRGISDLVPIRWRCPREVVLCHV